MDSLKKEPEITYSAVPITESGPNNPGPPIPAGHSRFYCKNCQMSYDLPDGATSWRCTGCHTFNATSPGECEWCVVQ